MEHDQEELPFDKYAQLAAEGNYKELLKIRENTK
jgi:hypothetical protein